MKYTWYYSVEKDVLYVWTTTKEGSLAGKKFRNFSMMKKLQYKYVSKLCLGLSHFFQVDSLATKLYPIINNLGDETVSGEIDLGK